MSSGHGRSPDRDVFRDFAERQLNKGADPMDVVRGLIGNGLGLLEEIEMDADLERARKVHRLEHGRKILDRAAQQKPEIADHQRAEC
jgi:hypothetical protein